MKHRTRLIVQVILKYLYQFCEIPLFSFVNIYIQSESVLLMLINTEMKENYLLPFPCLCPRLQFPVCCWPLVCMSKWNMYGKYVNARFCQAFISASNLVLFRSLNILATRTCDNTRYLLKISRPKDFCIENDINKSTIIHIHCYTVSYPNLCKSVV